ncbi:hypothetical protein ZEAMMB73_Zm00001d035656 [Zea mays]|uniref:Uncharacterized protein n=1 Tax=Zea mays TaxID=4577 RepID=A0A1D6LHP9_MAIZE|nr:hypothetical protein ZEAMMB73_Zm00001d035656 [Zea mays]
MAEQTPLLPQASALPSSSPWRAQLSHLWTAPPPPSTSAEACTTPLLLLTGTLASLQQQPRIPSASRADASSIRATLTSPRLASPLICAVPVAMPSIHAISVAPRALPMRRNASRWTAHATHRSGQVAFVLFTI